jgi:hypothetical protein
VARTSSDPFTKVGQLSAFGSGYNIAILAGKQGLYSTDEQVFLTINHKNFQWISDNDGDLIGSALKMELDPSTGVLTLSSSPSVSDVLASGDNVTTVDAVNTIASRPTYQFRRVSTDVTLDATTDTVLLADIGCNEITMPQSADVDTGRVFIIKNQSGSDVTITVPTPATNGLIDGNAQTIINNNDSIQLVRNDVAPPSEKAGYIIV